MVVRIGECGCGGWMKFSVEVGGGAGLFRLLLPSKRERLTDIDKQENRFKSTWFD